MARRWRDLLICEALALHTLADAGISAAHTELIEAEGRVFLESRRFDRTPQGRVGMVSLEVYDRQYIGQGTNWVDTARRSDRAGPERLRAADVSTLYLLDAFGALIANTDRHHGNISLLLREHRWQLAPAYDMLPMLYAPVAGELVPRDFAAQPPRPGVHTLAVWPKARELADALLAHRCGRRHASAPTSKRHGVWPTPTSWVHALMRTGSPPERLV